MWGDETLWRSQGEDFSSKPLARQRGLIPGLACMTSEGVVFAHPPYKRWAKTPQNSAHMLPPPPLRPRSILSQSTQSVPITRPPSSFILASSKIRICLVASTITLHHKAKNTPLAFTYVFFDLCVKRFQLLWCRIKKVSLHFRKITFTRRRECHLGGVAALNFPSVIFRSGKGWNPNAWLCSSVFVVPRRWIGTFLARCWDDCSCRRATPQCTANGCLFSQNSPLMACHM